MTQCPLCKKTELAEIKIRFKGHEVDGFSCPACKQDFLQPTHAQRIGVIEEILDGRKKRQDNQVLQKE